MDIKCKGPWTFSVKDHGQRIVNDMAKEWSESWTVQTSKRLLEEKDHGHNRCLRTHYEG